MPLEKALEWALQHLEDAEESGDYVAAVRWADALDRVISKRNSRMARPRRPRRDRGTSG